MRREKSAGAVIFNTKNRMFLLLHYPTHGEGHWDFPKGHIEKGEDETHAALREIKEETGLTVELLFGFREEIKYHFRDKNTLVEKTVVYFLAVTEEDRVVLSYEHDDYAWLDYKSAVNKITYESSRQVLMRAKKFLEKMGYL